MNLQHKFVYLIFKVDKKIIPVCDKYTLDIRTSVDPCWSNGGTSAPWLLLLHIGDITWVGWIENSEPPIWHFDLAFLLFLYFFNFTQYLPATSKEHQIVIIAVQKTTLLLITRPKNSKWITTLSMSYFPVCNVVNIALKH